MKKLLLALSVAPLFAAPVMAEAGALDAGDPLAAAPAVDGPSDQINLSGELQAPTCRIKEAGQQVVLAKVDVKDVDTKANVGAKAFSIDLVDCSPYIGKQVTVKFTPSEDKLETVGSEKILKNAYPAQDTAAKHVGFKITANGNNVLNSFDDLTQFAVNGYQKLNKSEISFNFSVEYAKTSAEAATPGYVTGALPFTVVYK